MSTPQRPWAFLLCLSMLGTLGCKPDQQPASLRTLDSLKTEYGKLREVITDMEKQLVARGELTPIHNLTPVEGMTVETQPFFHQIEFRGAVASRKDVVLRSEVAGSVVSIRVKEEDFVRKGKILVQFDDQYLRDNLLEVKTQFELAEQRFERQKRLWEQNIGTEIQLLSSEADMKALGHRQASLRSQLRRYRAEAPFSGLVDDLIIKVGEVLSPGMPILRLVNLSETYVSVDVSEIYFDKFQVGDTAKIRFPVLEKEVSSAITSIGKVVDTGNRTFEMEVQLPKLNFKVIPNQVVVVSLRDYENPRAFVLAGKMLQTDQNGHFVYEISDRDGEMVSSKRYIEPGISYKGRVEILEGLQVGMILAREGFNDLSAGSVVEIINPNDLKRVQTDG